MRRVTIASVVEGHGEVAALPILLRRIAGELVDPLVHVTVTTPHRLPSQQMRDPARLNPVLRVQAARISGAGGVLLLRDGDDKGIDCPVRLAEDLREAAGTVAARVEVVIARHEFESWLLAGIDSLRDHPVVRSDAMAPSDPEGRRGAAEMLQAQLTESYKKTLHPAKFCALIDLVAVYERSRSFRRMVHAVDLLMSTEER